MAKEPPLSKLAYTKQPYGLYAKVEFKKGSLTLIPLVNSVSKITKLTPDKPAWDEKAEIDGIQYNTKGSAKSDDLGKMSFIAPFWWVGDVTDKKAANMVFTQTISLNGVKVTCLQNSKNVQPGQLLSFFKQAPTKKVSEGKKLKPSDQQATSDQQAKKLKPCSATN